ncbi:hypothetical protein WKI13_14075 [Teredinibacter turnerae]|uniref:hypothetical protein n=1 Tax=Teredinibacter turnerae TaxID=2426 RepID=UPI00035D2BA6|nr:hypothetical protein [Teredinibacter turnerae]
MDGFNYITQLEGDLKACITLCSHEINAGYWNMRVQLFYENQPAGVASFNLHGYSQEEAESVAKNFNTNAYLMREIDEYLWGDSD